MAVGAGAGLVTAIAYGGLARSEKPHRNYGLFTMSQMIMAMTLLTLLPVLLAGEISNQASIVSSMLSWVGIHSAIGMKAFFGIMVCLSFLGLVLAFRWFPERPAVVSTLRNIQSPSMCWVLPGVMLLAIFTVMLSQQAFWSYSERIGMAADLNRSSVGTVLALGALSGLLGAGCATIVGNFVTRPVIIALIFVIHIAAMSFFFFDLNIYLFAIGIFLHKFAWNFTTPYQLGMLAEVENSGKAAVFSVVISAFGVAAGAGFAALVVGNFGYREMIMGVMGFAVVYSLLMLFLHFRLSATRS